MDFETICTLVSVFVIGTGFMWFIAGMLHAAADADDKAQARICPNCIFNKKRCEWNPKRCIYAESKTSQTNQLS